MMNETKLRTNTKQYAANFDAYMSDVFESEEYIKNYADLKAEFERVANYENNMRRLPNNQDRLADYLQGLPLNIEWQNFEILKLDQKLREYSNDLTDKQADTLLENYWKFMAYQIIKRW